MLITDKNELQKYSIEKRLWQGIPSIEVTKGGRIFLTYYSGGTKEEIGNYSILSKSDDGEHFEDIAITFKEGFRSYDPCLWIDPLGRLWFTWAIAPDHAVWASICDDPDAEELVWSEPRIIGREVMMNKPTVLTTGEWLFPIAIWDWMEIAGGYNGVVDAAGKQSTQNERLAFAYKSVDNGETFERLGGCNVPQRSFDEHMILELGDGRLVMFVRTKYGIGMSFSYDRGKTWTKGGNSGLGGPCSRFFIRRLKSGRVLLINHFNYVGRSHLTAMLSEDDCKTWPYKLLLDERTNVSYPDAKEADDGYIYVTYDRERGGFLDSLEKVYASAREVLIAKITEEDIIAGSLKSPESRLKQVVQKLGKYAYEDTNPYHEIDKFSDAELNDYLLEKDFDSILAILFDKYNINCVNMHKIDNERLDTLISDVKEGKTEKSKALLEIIRLIRSARGESDTVAPVVGRAKALIESNLSDDVTMAQIADMLNISIHYFCHVFKSTTGITPIEYKNSVKIAKAKNLLVNSDRKIADIALECGFASASYFSKVFAKNEGITPAEYRELLKR
ncbi:MAG: AraC family transcriptional regulator [Clostridia bacterium]|nr:AraC family transcriptional regulator [Clostridia bacterium]